MKKITPKKIKLGYATFKIEKRTNSFCESQEMMGDCDTQKLRIRYDKSQANNELANTILHEVLHALFHTQSINVSEKLEEKIVHSLANGLCAMIKDNPNFVDWLREKLK